MPNKFREPQRWAEWVYNRIEAVLTKQAERDGNARIVELNFWIRGLEEQGFYPSEELLDRVDRVIWAIRQVNGYRNGSKQQKTQTLRILDRPVKLSDFQGECVK